jgi:hypothetical protein
LQPFFLFTIIQPSQEVTALPIALRKLFSDTNKSFVET